MTWRSSLPDDPRPARWAHPVLALGNFDGLHRGHLKILERVRRVAVERGGTAVVHDLRPASAARRAARQGAAAADDQGQKLEALDASRRPGRGDRPLHARAVAVGSGDVRPHGAGRLAARRGSLGRRQFLFGHDRAGNFSLLRIARRAATDSGPRRSIRSATRTSSSAARASAGWSARAASTKPARCSATSTPSTARSSRATGAAGRIGFPTANLATENELLPPHGVYATTTHHRRHRVSGGDQRRRAADGRRAADADRRDARVRLRSGDLYGQRQSHRIRAAAARRAPFPTSTRCGRRSPPTSPGARAVRSAFTCKPVTVEAS